MKATEVIRRDHAAAKELFETYQNAAPEERGKIAKDLLEALTRHELMEDRHFYPALKEVAGDDPALSQVLDEQTRLKGEVLGKGTMELITGDDPDRMTQVMEDVLAHAKEEEDIIFPKAEALLEESALEKLGDEMEPESAVAHAST